MNKRHLFITASLISLFVALVIYYAWGFFEVDKRLQRAIGDKLESAFGNKLDIGKVQLGLGTIHLRNIAYNTPSDAFRIDIDDISLGYSLINLIKEGFHPERVNSDIIVSRPRIFVSLSPQKPKVALATKTGQKLAVRKSAAVPVPSLNFIERLTINQGEIILVDSVDTASQRLIRNLDGTIETQPDGKAFAKLAGKLFDSDDYNTFLSGTLDFNRSWFDSLALDLHEYRLADGIPFVLPTAIHFEDGVVNSHLAIISQNTTYDFRVKGSVAVVGGQLKLAEDRLWLEDINVAAFLDNRKLRIEAGTLQLNRSPFELAGDIDDLLHPSPSLVLRSSAFDIATFSKRAIPGKDFSITGFGDVQVVLQNIQHQRDFIGTFAADSLFVGKQRFDNVSFVMDFQDSVLHLQNLVTEKGNSQLQGWGTIQIEPDRSNSIDLSLVAHGDFSATVNALNLVQVTKSQGTIVAQVRGPLASPIAKGNFDLMIPDKDGENLELLGNFAVRRWKLAMEVGTADGKFVLAGDVDQILDKPYFDLKVQNIGRVAGLFYSPLPSVVGERYRIDGKLDGYASAMRLQVSGFAWKNNREEFRAAVSVSDSLLRGKNVTGTLDLYPSSRQYYSTQFSTSFIDSNTIIIELGNQHWLSGTIRIDVQGDQNLAGNIKLSGLELEKVSPRNNKNQPKYTGRLFGELKLSGNVKNPLIEADSWLLDGFMNGAGVFSGEVALKADKHGLVLTKFDIQHDGLPYFKADGAWRFSPRSIDFDITGENINTNTTLKALTGRDSILVGKADIAVHLRGDRWPVPAYGSIDIHRGRIMWFLFDDLKFNFGDLTAGTTASHIGNGGIFVDDITYTKAGQYVLRGAGKFPFDNHSDMEVKLAGTGNFLACLPDIATVFKATSSNGDLRLGLRGAYEHLKLFDSHLRVRDGRLQLSRVAKEIDNISGECSADDGFIDIKHIAGKIGDATLTVTNRRGGRVGADSVATPLVINRSWMSLGHLIVRSGETGLPLSIPALMENGEVGRFRIEGRDGDPGFFIAGPWQHPVFRGAVVLSDVNLMFPFDESSSAEVDPLIMNILMNANWDVLTIAGKDNRYVKKFPTGIDNVYVNAGIDDQVSRLLFTGIVRDTTIAPGAPANAIMLADGLARADKANNGADRVPSPLQFWVRTKERRTDVGPDTSTFRIEGTVESTRGNIEYLDLNFRIDKFGAIWDRSELQPIVYGRGWTVVPDSSNLSQNVYLQVYSRDPVSGEERQQGRWESCYFKLESDNPTYNISQAHVLASLGYSLATAKERATDVLGISTDNLLFRPLLRPVERTLERSLKLDVVRLNSRFTRNFLEMNMTSQLETKLALLRSTKLTLGKYLSDRMYLLYTGQIEAWPQSFNYADPNLGLRHTLGLEYRFNPGLLLQMEYDYNTVLQAVRKDDKKIWLRHSFPF